MAINKNIFQMHNSYGRLGPFERVAIERWRAINPDWNYRFIVDGELDEYVSDLWGEHADVYREMNNIQKSQILRAAVVYQNGGIYSDCDIYPIHKLKDFIPLESSAAWFKLKDRPDKRIMIGDCFFGAEKSNPILDEIIHEAFRRTVSCKHMAGDDWESYAGYIYESSSVHAYSDIVVRKHNEPLLEGGDNWVSDIKENPDKCHYYHYSTESWVPNNRFQRDGVDPFANQMEHLTMIKELTGI